MASLYGATLEDMIDLVQAGRLEPKYALMWATKKISDNSKAYQWKGYLQLVCLVLPMIKWNPEGDEIDVPGGVPTVWRRPADFYEWANVKCGEAFAVGALIEKYISTATPEQRNDIERKTQDRWDRIGKSKRLVNEEGKGIREAAREIGCSHPTVLEDLKMVEKTAYAEKSTTKRTEIRISIFSSTNPSTAAQKIKDKFGREFSMALAAELLESLKEE